MTSQQSDAIGGKCIAITGGATGIGFALAKELGRYGANIMLMEPREARLVEAVALLNAAGIAAGFTIGDVCRDEDLAAFVADCRARFGRADMVIANAGVGGGALAKGYKADLAAARALFDVNFWGVWATIQHFWNDWRAEGEAPAPASVYAVASENALFNAFPFGGGAYVASKHAVHGLMATLRRDAPDWLRVGTIFPGWVQSEISELNQSVPAAMPADDYAAIIAPQLIAGEPWVVSHGYNLVRFEERYAEMRAAFDRFAPRREGDERYDVQNYFAQMLAQRAPS